VSVVARIGPCKGCARVARLDDGVCLGCLGSPRRGRRWAELGDRVRRDPELARQVFDAITSDRGRRLFVTMFGLPSFDPGSDR